MGTLALPVLECLNCVRGDSAPFSPTRVSLSAYIGKIKARLNLRDGSMEIWSALVPWVCKAKPGKAFSYESRQVYLVDVIVQALHDNIPIKGDVPHHFCNVPVSNMFSAGHALLDLTDML